MEMKSADKPSEKTSLLKKNGNNFKKFCAKPFGDLGVITATDYAEGLKDLKKQQKENKFAKDLELRKQQISKLLNSDFNEKYDRKYLLKTLLSDVCGEDKELAENLESKNDTADLLIYMLTDVYDLYTQNCKDSAKGVSENQKDEEISDYKVRLKIQVKHYKKVLKDKYNREDILVYMLTTAYDEHTANCKEGDSCIKFIFELSQVCDVILENYREENYRLHRQKLGKKNVLHLAAEKNLWTVVKSILRNGFNLDNSCYTDENNVQIYPIDLALEKVVGEVEGEKKVSYRDETASVLIAVGKKSRLLDKFMKKRKMEENSVENPSIVSKTKHHSFGELIKRGKEMKRTVMAILDQFVSRDLHSESQSEIEGIPQDGKPYHFDFTLLECDGAGRQYDDPEHDGKPCLQLLIQSTIGKDAMEHPVVRKLVDYKWNNPIKSGWCLKYKHVVISFMLFLLSYIVFMSCAFFLQPFGRPVDTYYSKVDNLRLFSEIMTLFMAVVYFFAELLQLKQEGLRVYFGITSIKAENLKEGLINFFDVCGIIGVFFIAGLHFTKYNDARLVISGLVYFFNCLRFFKYLPVEKHIGVYARTFTNIMFYDVSKFFCIFVLFLVTFTGSVYMFLRTAHQDWSSSSEFWNVTFKELRSVIEAEKYDDNYDFKVSKAARVFLIIFFMLNMFIMMVVLLNFLIGQISHRYERALELASLDYDVDKAKLVVRAEAIFNWWCWVLSKLPCSLFKYQRSCTENIYVADDKDINDLVKYWVQQKTQEVDDEDLSKEFSKCKLKASFGRVDGEFVQM